MSLQAYWAGLQSRERHTLIAGALALILLLGYALVWEPYQSELKRLRQSVAEQEQLLAWMEQAAAEVAQLRRSAPARSASRQPLLTLVDTTARQRGLGGALKRVQPDGEAVQVWLEQAAFDEVLRWVDGLARSHGIRVNGMVVERAEASGLVNARLVLEGGA
jgi:general secretion pathway protein M